MAQSTQTANKNALITANLFFVNDRSMGSGDHSISEVFVIVQRTMSINRKKYLNRRFRY